ncbi:MAG TPA: hypothetical protein VFV50_02055 [Bdellovibrionales bacterium]|nr:hypothetical protein [Bdellovibrionales bacterium]
MKRNAFAIFMIALALPLLYNSCAQNPVNVGGGSSVGTPMVELSFDSFVPEAGNQIEVCVEHILMTQQSADATQIFVPVLTQNRVLAPEGLLIDSRRIPAGRYGDVTMVLSDRCDTNFSLKITNSSGTYTSQTDVTLSFSGDGELQEGSARMTFGVQSLASALATVTMNAQLVPAAEGAGGNWTAQPVSLGEIPSFVQALSSFGSLNVASFTSSFAAPNSAGNTIVVVCQTNEPAANFTVSDANGNTYAPVVGRSRAGHGRAGMFYAANIAGGANSVTCTSTISNRFVATHIAEIAGLHPATTIDATGSSDGFSASPSLGLTTTEPYTFLVHYIDFQTGPLTSDASSTRRYNRWTADDTYNAWHDRVMGAAGTFTFNAAITSSNWIYIGAAFKRNTTP